MLVQANSSVQSALNSGLQAYQQGSGNMSNASRELASGMGDAKRNANINMAAADLVSGSLQAEAAANVISRADGMLGTIIDTYA